MVPLASIARLEGGEVTYTIGGNIYADDTRLQSAADLSGRKVLPFAAFSLLLHRIPLVLDKDCIAICR